MTTTSLFRHRAARAVACALTLSLAARAPLAAQATAAAPATGVTAVDAWVREAPAGRKATAIFLTARNAGGTARTIVSGTSSASETLELHEMKRENGMMRMAPVPNIVVPANGEVALRPGGLHLMLFGLKGPLVVGDTVRVTLMLDGGERLSFKAPVRAMAAMP